MTPEALAYCEKQTKRIAELEQQVSAQQAQMYEDRRQALVWRDQVAALTKEHEFACEIGADYRDKWMAAQAREAKLREALERIVKWDSFPATGKYWDDPNGCQPMSYSAAYGSNGERDFMRSVAVTALASPTDDSALIELLKEERERICGLYSPDDTASDFMDKIRGLA